jgi:hypothetical protein
MHGYSEWSSINIDQLPVAVAYPRSTAEVSQVAKVCHKYRMPMGQSTLSELVYVCLISFKYLILEAPVWKPTSLRHTVA